MASDLTDIEVEAKSFLDRAARTAAGLAGGDVPGAAARAAVLLLETLRGGGKVLLCGNGGSAADAQHIAAELVGRMGADRAPLAGLALTTDTSNLTALANDHGFEEVFARQVRALGRAGDTLIALSTSGASENVVRAAAVARTLDMRVIALLGPHASPVDDLAEIALHLPGESSSEIQQGHITVGHLLCSLVESQIEA